MPRLAHPADSRVSSAAADVDAKQLDEDRLHVRKGRWSLIDEWLRRHELTATATLIDRFHVDERLAQTCELISQDGVIAAELFEHWGRCLDRSDTAMHRICRRLDELSNHMVGSAMEGEPAPPYWEHRARTRLSGEHARIVWGNHQYFHRHRAKMQYARSIRMGLPIGSGVTEGACKSVVTMRFKRSGQRWLESGLTPCLQLRARHLNRRLRPCFDLLVHARQHELAAVLTDLAAFQTRDVTGLA